MYIDRSRILTPRSDHRIDRGGTIETPDPISYRFHAAPRRNRGECERLSGTDRYGERLRNLDIFPDR